jgi:hypothetical protein
MRPGVVLLVAAMVMTTGLARAQDNGRPNATFPEQYATVLVASDFQPPESPDSQFMGILYITAEFVDGMVVLHTTLWHSVNFAVSAVINCMALSFLIKRNIGNPTKIQTAIVFLKKIFIPNRNKRCSLSAQGNIKATEIKDYWQSCSCVQFIAIA